MSATRSSRKAAPILCLPVTGDFLRAHAERLSRDLDVLVAAAREVHDEVLAPPELTSHRLRKRYRVRGLERGDDTLELRTQSKSSDRLPVGGARVLGEPLVLEVGVLGARRRVVEAGGDRVR